MKQLAFYHYTKKSKVCHLFGHLIFKYGTERGNKNILILIFSHSVVHLGSRI